MKIKQNTVVQLAYSVAEVGHPPFEQSGQDAPLTVLIGHGQLVPGLERALMERGEGEKIDVDVKADDAYGPYREGLIQRLPKKKLDGAALAVNAQVILKTQFGPRAVTIKKIGLTVIDVDLNHPYAGKDLHFSVDILAVRSATPEEISHGHVHHAPT